jgi:hypothetical protein
MRNAAALQSLADPRAQASLQRAVEQLKEFEFQLARNLSKDDAGGMRVGRTSDVPAEFKKAVEDYYRAVGTTPTKDPKKDPPKPPTKPGGGE